MDERYLSKSTEVIKWIQSFLERKTATIECITYFSLAIYSGEATDGAEIARRYISANSVVL